MPDRRLLSDLTREEIDGLAARMGQPRFRAGQLYGWASRGAAYAEMTNLPRAFRDELEAEYADAPLRLVEAFKSRKDDTVKFLFGCLDGHVIEGVLMRYHYGYSLCASTQVGCNMGCAFCASTLDGCARSLSSGEILAQVQLADRFLGDGERVGHVVLMGSGEPLDNYDNVMRFLRRVNEPEGLNISLRNVSLSTCGLVPQMRRLAGEGLPVTLSISLHAPNDEIRRRIMPVARAYPIEELMDAAREYVARTGRRVIFEYALIDGLNSEPAQARELAALLRGLQCHVNLIPLNHVSERSLAPASPEAVRAFLAALEERRISATVRREMGGDVSGACGQLRRSYLQSER